MFIIATLQFREIEKKEPIFVALVKHFMGHLTASLPLVLLLQRLFESDVNMVNVNDQSNRVNKYIQHFVVGRRSTS